MSKKLILTSLTAIAIAMPAMADMTETSTFPTGADGYMAANTKYLGAATSTNMDGVYEGSVNATAYYEDILYTIAAGQYLAHGTTSGTECPSGSFCGGLTDVTYDATNDKGITSCSTLENGAYPSSVAGATANTQCYRACSGNVTIAHATGVTGNDYYGAGVDTCEPTACENGWHVKPGAPDLTTSIGVTQAGTSYAAINNSGKDMNINASTYSLSTSDHNAFVVDYGGGKKISGHGRCSKTGVTTPWYNAQGYQFASDHFVNNLTNETDPETGGQYCYCQLDGYTLTNSTMQSLSAPWVFSYDFGNAEFCAYACANYCAYYLQYGGANNLAFRAAVFGSLGSSLASCEANQITINWHDVDPTYAGQNNEGTATYGGDIRTPFKALDKTNEGKSFKGWRFEKPTPSQGD